MRKPIKITLGAATLVALVLVLMYFKDANSKSIIEYETQVPFYTWR